MSFSFQPHLRPAGPRTLFFLLLILLPAFSLTGMPTIGKAAAPNAPETVMTVTVDPPLAALGVRATTAKPAAPKSGKKAAPPQIVVFATFDKAYTGTLYLRGFRTDGTEVARSAIKPVKRSRNAGGNIEFDFDADTSFKDVARVLLAGEAGPVPKPAPPKESFGEEVKNIARELVE